jgi:uncharacterized protein (DUF1778 family)
MRTVRSNLKISNPRISARMPAHVHETITRAAEIMGATINQFMIQSALEKANSIIEKEQVIRLSTESATLFYDAIESPPAPNQKLTATANAYKKTIIAPL